MDCERCNVRGFLLSRSKINMKNYAVTVLQKELVELRFMEMKSSTDYDWAIKQIEEAIKTLGGEDERD